MKKLVAFIVLLGAAGGGWWWYINYGTPPPPPQVITATVSRGNVVEAVQSTGTLEPERRYDVGSQVSGTVKQIHVDYNSIVKKGQLLAEIDPQLLQVQVDIQRANIERQESDIANQKVQLEDQKKQFERTKSLHESGLINQQAFEAAELAIKTREAQIASAEKGLVQARHNLASAMLNVDYTKIYAPDDGVVLERRVDVGQTVQASTTTPQFFILVKPLQNLRLTAQVDEAEIGRIRPGMEVRFIVEAYGQETFYGSVDTVRMNALTQNNVVTYPVWIRVPNADLRLRPSMTANPRIVISTADDVIRIPSAALRFRPNAETYTALGATPPAAGQGRVGGRGNNNEGGNGQTQPQTSATGQGAQGQQAQAGQGRAAGQGQAAGQAPPAGGQGQQARAGGGGQGANATAGEAGRGGRGGRGGGRGGGQPSDIANMTPEQNQRLAEMAARGGGGAGRTGRGQGAGRGQAAPQPPPVGADLDKIDSQWAPVQRLITTANVYTWNAEAKELKQIPVRLGVSDGSWSQLVSGEVNVGDLLVTGVMLPASQARPGGTNTQNPFSGQQQRAMPGGIGGTGGGGGGGGRGGGGGGGRGGD
jgi:HlyD family secretion protein